MEVIAIKLSNGQVYFARCEPKTASEDPLTTEEKVILDLYKQLNTGS